MVRVENHSIYDSESRNMQSPEYTKLKDLIILKVGMSEMHSQIIQAMKALYQNDINSTRRFEKIVTIGQLLKILEIRDLLSEQNILPLKMIAERLPNNMDMIENIKEFEKVVPPRQYVNYYAVEPVKNKRHLEQKPPANTPIKQSSFMDGISEAKRERIIETVREGIGQHWRNLARYLGVQEYKIDEIQAMGINIEEKAMKILELYNRKADREKWYFDLMNALEKAHRRDLCDELKTIATMNIID